MEAALELEDDVFFADLSKQLSLLIMDDGNDDDESLVDQFSSVNLQAFTQSKHIPATRVSYNDHGKRESKGTGVFIPLSSHPGRRNKKQGRFAASSNNKFQRPCDQYHSSRGLPQMAYNDNNISSSYYDTSSNLRRF